MFNLALSLSKKYRFSEALEILKKLYKQDKTNITILYNLARTYTDLQQYKKSIKIYSKLLKLYPEHTQSYFDRSILYFYLGKFKKWRKDYEKRLDFKEFNSPLPIKLPKNKKKLKNKKILIFAEQGFGDNINFIKFIKKLDYKDVDILVYKPLLKLFKTSFKKYNFIQEIKKTDYDFVIPLLSLPKILDIKFTPSKAYLKVKKKDIKQLDKKYINIGLFWQGNKNSPRDKYRSIEFSLLNNLLNLTNKNVRFYSLQKDITIYDKRVKNLKNINDFYDSACLIKALDLVISVDSSILHLSGALGVETYLLAGILPDFRWQIDSSNNLWYKSLEIFRQKKLFEWQDVLFKVQQKVLKKIDIKDKNIILFRSYSGSSDNRKLIRIGDFVAYFILANYFKTIHNKYLIFSITSRLPLNFRADILTKDIFDEIYIGYEPNIKKYFDPDTFGGLWHITPLLYERYGNNILPFLTFDENIVEKFTQKKDYIVFAPLVNASYNTDRNMDIDFVNRLSEKLHKKHKNSFFVIVEDENLIKNKNINIIKSSNLYNILFFIKNSKIFIGGDTGFSHFSAILRVKIIITLYGTKYPQTFNNLNFNSNIMIDTTTTKHYNFILKNNRLDLDFLKEVDKI